ncbi:E3 ubiquitin-protein ligase SHPRH-like [Ylistrum balloti]|uniref:E3 ubiquitin-protein ligase SHPRH-like n=1 Tax=Ylistrum balloti TaxID=509963 RepID=UPI002905A6D8|nr:E3 ubiquitin-protein ligase SHPRH-like [Ylistrum balloti]
MGRRKQGAPQRASAEKRRCLEWNMLEGVNPEGSLVVLDDNDPSILNEAHQVQGSPKRNVIEADSTQQSQFSTQQMQDMFEDNLKYCSYSVRVMSSSPFQENEWHTMLGVFSIKLLPCLTRDREVEDCLQSDTEIWLYVSEVESKSMLYFEKKENDDMSKSRLLKFWCVEIDIPTEVLAVFDNYNTKMAVVIISHYDHTTLRFDLTIHAREALLYKPKFPSEHVRMKKQNILLRIIMSHFYGLTPRVFDQEISSKKHDIEALYTAIKATHDKEEITAGIEVQHPSLIPHLRPYQRKGVSWMLSREGLKVEKNQPTDSLLANTEVPIHMLYEEVKTLGGNTLYYNKYLGSLTMERQERLVIPPGGILADEMGLGKTVEVLACILLHRSPVIEQPPRLPTLKEMNIDMDGSQRHVHVKHVHVKVNNSDKSLKIVPEVEVVNGVDSLKESECVVNDIITTPENEESEDIGSQGKVKVEGNKTLTTEVVNSACDGHVVESNAEDCVKSDPCDNVGKVEDEGQSRGESHGPTDKADSCDNTPNNTHRKISTVCGNGEDASTNLIKNVDIKEKDLGLSLSSSEARSYKESITQDTGLLQNVADVDETRSLVNEGICDISGGSVDNIETRRDVGQAMDGPVASTCSELVKTADSPQLEAGSRSTRKTVKKRRRKKWTLKKKSRRLSHCSHVDVEDSDIEDGADGVVTGNIETVALCNKEEPEKQKTEKCKKQKGKSKKIKPVPSVEVKLDDMTNRSEGKKMSKPKKGSIPSRFVEVVEESSFKPKYQFFGSTPIRRKHFFECICGATTATSGKKRHSVQCVDCGLQQHAECVHYNLDDPFRGNFRCPHCHVSSSPIKSGATLIISPSSICHQWVDEILKHIRSQSLKVFVYTGVNKLGFIQPRTLAQQDIVITTYETLRKEIDYVDLPHSNSDTTRAFRNPKRFMAIPSPLTAVEWWRVCLDEAQMVEVTTSKTAEMALRLSAVNRWCVTGTPIQKSVSDVYGLLLFLGLDPYWVKHWWTTLLYNPFCQGDPQPLHNVLSSVLWRNAKKDVIDQINIPDQSEHVHWLTFSPVEDHFYRRQYKDCASAARRSYSKWTDLSTKLSSLDRHTVSQLLSPLLKLRQACCHPQAVRGEFIPLQKNTMTMDELLESLIKKAQTECEESHRQLVAAINGTAGLHIIKEEYSEAVDMYREVLWSVEEHKDYLRTDKLQLLHTLYNLHEILSLKPEGVAPTLRDGLLKQQADEMRKNYMLKAEAKVTSSQSSLTPTQQNMAQFRAELSDGLEWWLEVIKFAEERQTDEILVEMVKSELMRDYVDNHINPHVSMARLFHGSRGLELTIHGKLVALESAHEKLLQGIGKLCEPVTQDILNQSVECCLRPVGQVPKTCELCLVDKLFEEYESKLFSFTQKPVATVEGDHTNTTRRQGTWADSELEKSLKVILSFAKLYRVGHYLIEFGTTHIKLMDSLKKEFKNLRSVWMSKHEQFQALDELDMATTRLRLRLPDEDVPTATQLHVLEPAELEQQKIKLRTEKIVAKNELRKKIGQLFYLKNLSKNQVDNEGGVNPEPCPICQRELGVEWSVVQCGHCYCIECIRVMVIQYSFGTNNRRLKCAVCRQLNFISDISYVSTKVTPVNDGLEGVRVKGSYSIKIEAVVRCMLGIQKNDPAAKVLVFSSWKSVLGIIAEALDENNITHRTLYTGKFQNQLTSFREEKDVMALLLPIQSGSNGLNLIEATYVLLVEPILNPAQELQAIGRVHRIGQTRKTEVHRFLIRGTIEEKIYSMIKTIEDVPSSHNTEENILTVGHLTSLLHEDEVDRGQGHLTDNGESQELPEEDEIGTVEVASQSVEDTGTTNVQGNREQIQIDDITVEATSHEEEIDDDTSEVCVIEDSPSEQECVLSSEEEFTKSEVMYYEPYSQQNSSEDRPTNEPVIIDEDSCEPINITITNPGDVPSCDVIDVDTDAVEETMVVDDDWKSQIVDLTSIEESSVSFTDPKTIPQDNQQGQKILRVDTQAVVDLTSDDEDIGSLGDLQVGEVLCAGIGGDSLVNPPYGSCETSGNDSQANLDKKPYPGSKAVLSDKSQACSQTNPDDANLNLKTEPSDEPQLGSETQPDKDPILNSEVSPCDKSPDDFQTNNDPHPNSEAGLCNNSQSGFQKNPDKGPHLNSKASPHDELQDGFRTDPDDSPSNAEAGPSDKFQPGSQTSLTGDSMTGILTDPCETYKLEH